MPQQNTNTTEDKTIEKDLKNIYSNDEGKIEDVSRLEIKKSNPIKLLSILAVMVAFFGFVIVWIYFFYGPQNSQKTGRTIALIIASESEIASGEDLTYTIDFSTKDKVSLVDAELILKYPTGFQFASADPPPDNQYNNIWDIGELEAGGSRQVKVFGKIVGEQGSFHELEATMSFIPENFSSRFKETFSFVNQITSSILTLSIQGSATVLPEKTIVYTLNYGNTSEKDLNNVLIQVDFPEAFLVTSSDPEVLLPPYLQKDGINVSGPLNNYWYFDVLESESTGKIEIQGQFKKSDNAEPREETLIAQIGFVEDEERFSLQLEKNLKVALVDHNVKIDFLVNGSAEDSTVNFNDELHYLIVYKNLREQTLSDFSVTVELDSDVFDYNTIIDQNLGKIEGKTITWDEDSFSHYSALQPFEEGEIEFTIKIKDVSAINADSDSLETRSQVSAHIGKIDDLLADISIKSDPILHIINTALDMISEVRYFNDDNIAVGSGPLPPQVGKKTSFRIYWKLSNNIHPVKDVSVITELADGVLWADKSLLSVGSLNYAESDKKVIWTIDKIESKKGFDDVYAWFDVEIEPNANQVGKLILLTTDTSLRATDAVTESGVVQVKRSMTTNLEDDPFGGGRGLVEEGE